MKENSYWYQGRKKKTFPKIEENKQVDVLIIGGGITGILCAYYLKDTNLRVALVEKGRFGMDMTGFTTGKLTCLQGVLYQQIEQLYGYDLAYLYLSSQIDAMNEMLEIMKKENIDCEYQSLDTYIYSKHIDGQEELHREKAFFMKSKIDIIDNLPKDIYALDGFGIKDQGAFHPLKYIDALINICSKSGVLFYEDSYVDKIKHDDLMQEAYVNGCKIKSMHAIITTRFPLNQGVHNLTFTLNQSITYLSYSPSSSIDYQSICIDSDGITMRPVKDGMLIGGYSHDVGDKLFPREDVKKNLQKLHEKEITYLWSGQDCLSGRHLPYIGFYNSEDNFCYVASGFNKWGMTNSHVAGKLISDIILNRKNKYQSLFDPLSSRYNLSLTNIKKLVKHSYLGYLKYRLETTMDDHEKIDGKIIYHKGKYIGLAFDEHKCLYKVNPVCTHLKGLLTFNPVSRTWDCINHGSRFYVDGTLYKGPAKKDLTIFSKEGENMKITYITVNQIKFNKVPYSSSLYESIKKKGISIPLKAVLKEGVYYCKDGHKRLSIIEDLEKEGIHKRISVIATNDGSTRSNDCWNSKNTH